MSGPDVQVNCIWTGPATLGESPLWDHRAGQLFWIDSQGKSIWRMSFPTREMNHWPMPEEIGSIGLCHGGGLLVALENRFCFFNPKTGHLAQAGMSVSVASGTRLNDGKVDRAGRYWCGTMNRGFSQPNATLYRLDPDLSLQVMDNGFVVSNGIAFSLDNTALYFSDSRPDLSYVYDFDLESGSITNRRAFASVTTYSGRIDGACVDSNGNYWAALFEGAAVGCFSATGALLRRISLPVSCPTMCGFGGPDMDILFVTSATFSLTQEELAVQPQAGGVFAIHGLGVTGVPEPEFGGQPMTLNDGLSPSKTITNNTTWRKS